MSSVLPAELRTLAKAPIGTTLVSGFWRSHGSIVRAFEPLLARFGKQAAVDVVLLDELLAVGMQSANGVSLEAGWMALGRLDQLVAKASLTGPQLSRVGLELELRRQALLALDGDFARIWSESAAKAIKEIRNEVVQKAIETAAKDAAKVTDRLTPAAVIAQLGHDLAAADPALVKLWNKFRLGVPELSPFAINAAEIAAERAQPVWRILQADGAVAGRAKLMGHLVGVRGALGEGYALADPLVRAELLTDLASAQAAALKLGPGHEAVYLTQVEHNIRLMTGAEGPDALVLIVNRQQGTAYVRTGVQVKVAVRSEAAEQTINDAFRFGGVERSGAGSPTRIEFRLTPESEPEFFLLSTSPLVERRSIIVNMGGSRVPQADLQLLGALGFRVDERVLDMSVGDLTHLAISKMEAALNAAKKAGLLK